MNIYVLAEKGYHVIVGFRIVRIFSTKQLAIKFLKHHTKAKKVKSTLDLYDDMTNHILYKINKFEIDKG